MKTSTILSLLVATTSLQSFTDAFGVAHAPIRSKMMTTTTTTTLMADVADDMTKVEKGEEDDDDDDDEKIPSLIVLNGKNIELTPAISEYVEKKIGETLKKLASKGFVRECDVHLSVNKNKKVKNRHRVDLNANLKGLTIHCKEESSDMYASIDAVAHALNRKLRKYKERRDQGFHVKKAGIGADIMDVLETMEAETVLGEEDDEEDEDYVDPEAPTITKIKNYDLDHAISMEEAVFALDYIDHDFYVFRNEETKKVNIVFKRTFGDIGLIEV